MSFLETFLSNSPVLSVINAAQSVCVTASVVAIGCPVHLCSLASCYNIDNLEDFQNNYNLTDPFCDVWLPEETISIMLQGWLPARVTPAVGCHGGAATLAEGLT